MSEGGGSLPAGVVLAAGASRRMGRPKALLTVEGEPFVRRIARRMTEAGLSSVSVVVGEPHGVAVSAAVADLPGVEPVVNPRPELGQLSSLRCALAHRLAPGGLIVALVDHPDVAAATYRALAHALADVALPSYRGRRGHPIRLGPAVYAELLAAPLDAGTRAVIHRDPARIALVAVDDPEVLRDVDAPDDYHRLLACRGS